MAQGEDEARDALKAFYSSKGEEIDDDEVTARQTVRGTQVRNLASSRKTSDQAKRFLPPFLNNDEKDQIIHILAGQEENQMQNEEVQLRQVIRGFIRG